MKKLKILALIVILAGFALQSANAQAIVEKSDVGWTIVTPDGEYISTHWHKVQTPSGNILEISIFFEIDVCDPIVPEKGIKKLDSGTGFTLFIMSNGHAVLKLYTNGKYK